MDYGKTVNFVKNDQILPNVEFLAAVNETMLLSILPAFGVSFLDLVILMTNDVEASFHMPSAIYISSLGDYSDPLFIF